MGLSSQGDGWVLGGGCAETNLTTDSAAETSDAARQHLCRNTKQVPGIIFSLEAEIEG